ncbi:DUF1127 domain-containing protein [Dongia sp.]|uniref:DUF1127 domain-containing protein n=1 Tax=Dongia sp. TaxID=1977262 RepID=UPI0035B28AFA
MSQSSIFPSALTAQRAQITSSAGTLALLVTGFQAWRERSRSRRDLMRLSEHQLQDIGLSRLDAETEWQKPFWQP